MEILTTWYMRFATSWGLSGGYILNATPGSTTTQVVVSGIIAASTQILLKLLEHYLKKRKTKADHEHSKDH